MSYKDGGGGGSGRLAPDAVRRCEIVEMTTYERNPYKNMFDPIMKTRNAISS